MKSWIPITVAAPLAVGVAAWVTLIDTGQRATFTEGIDPGEIACTELVSGDLLALLHDDYAQWGTDVYYLAQDAADSTDHGIATAASEIVELVDTNGGEFSPFELHPMTENLAEACVAAGHVTNMQVAKAKGR